MKYLQAAILITIIVLTSIIIYNLNLENRFIKEATKKEIDDSVKGTSVKGTSVKGTDVKGTDVKGTDVKEGFSTAITDNAKFPLREFLIQSSYNSAIKNKKASKDQLTELLNKGVRLFDFEIYTRNGDEYISYAEDAEFRRLETDLDLTVADAFSHISSKAFSEPKSGPLFIHLRVKTPSTNTFKNLSSNIQTAFGTKLLSQKTKVNGSTYIEDLIDKVVIIHDLTSGIKPQNYACEDKCIQYVDLVNIFSGTIDLPLYTQYEYIESMGLTKKISIEPETGKTDIDTFYMVAPSSFESRCKGAVCKSTSLIETMHDKPCQMMLLSYEDDEEIKDYLSIFTSAGTSYCPVSQIIRKNNIET